MLDQIPLHRPSTPLLDSVSTPAQLRNLSEQQLPQLAEELRSFLLYSVGQTGGHFGAGLGVVELTIALHYLLDTPRDKLVWDVGHQTYPHKILTGRREQMHTIRQLGGLSGFPLRSESEYDCFGVGHSSTSISAALGMALATAKNQPPHQCVAVIGDGAMTAGMAFEALNHAAHTGADLLVVLNDNDMSISHNIGGLAKPHRVSDKGLPAGNLFRDMGFDYTGPVDGHRFDDLLSHLRTVLLRRGPRLLHICTQKGKGFGPAERDPVGYHALTKIEPRQVQATAETKPPGKKYQQVFGEWLSAVAERDPKLVAITPAMSEGSGMVDFANTYPARFHDVGIAEQHAVTLAAGLACEAMKPVVAIYSTFLQRAYDQLIHDVCLQNLDVLFAIDRAGLVGEDGPSHAGSFDISFLRCIPNMVIAVPGDENECYQLLTAAYNHPGPAAVRYPRGKGPGAEIHKNSAPARVGKGVLRRSGEALCILNFGAPLADALAIAEKNNYTLCDMRWAKPLDTELILEQSSTHRYLVTLEENALAGGAGSAVAELLAERGTRIQLLRLGLPDRFIEQGKRARLLHEAGLSRDLMERRIQHFIQQGAAPARAGK